MKVEDSVDMGVVNAIYGLGILLAAAALLTLTLTMRKEPDIRRVYTLAFPFIALVFLVLPCIPDVTRGPFMLASTTVGTMGTTYLFLVALKAKAVYRVPASGAYGVFGPVVFLCMSLGMIEVYGRSSYQFDPRYLVFIMLVVYALLVILLVSRRRENSRREQPGVVFIGTEELFDRRCAALAEGYGLSQREREIMRMLVMGKSVDSIGEALCISVNTVRTHNKNLYKKLGVHAKGDLLNLVAAKEERLECRL